MENNINTKIEAAFKDKQFTDKLLSLEEPEDVQKAFAERGIDFTLDEVKEIGKRVTAETSGEELEENSLEEVAGGIVVTTAAVIATVAACANLVVAVGKAIKAKW